LRPARAFDWSFPPEEERFDELRFLVPPEEGRFDELRFLVAPEEGRFDELRFLVPPEEERFDELRFLVPRVPEAFFFFFAPDFFPPRFSAPGLFAIAAARPLLIPFLRSPSYCLSSFTDGP